MVISNSEFVQISILGDIWRCMKPGSLQARTGLCAICTETRFIFSVSPFQQFTFDIKIALVQTRYQDDKWARISVNFHCQSKTLLHETW